MPKASARSLASALKRLTQNRPAARTRKSRAPRRPDLFSDLNQWMLKVLIGQRLPETLIAVPRDPIRNASQLANIADVSIMSASRFVTQLSERNFLHRRDDLLQIARVEELLDLWISANREAADEIPARWIIKKGADQLKSTLRDYAAPHPNRSVIKRVPRCCLALFAAADALGYGFVHGAPAHVYLESLTLDALGRLGLAVDHSGRPPDVYIRKPANREAVFRAQVTRDGIPISDILQVWLDASTHPARGKEQAREIQRRVLKQFLGRQR
jgi:DNA-binding MarR family transcriptional regulator